jgi:hypothetical protein
MQYSFVLKLTFPPGLFRGGGRRNGRQYPIMESTRYQSTTTR